MQAHALPWKPCTCGASNNGASRDRTGDLLLAKQALSQLSYGPAATECRAPTASQNNRRYSPATGADLLVKVEVPRRALLEPKTVLLGGLA